MRRIAICTVALTAALAGPADAKAPKAKDCTPQSKGFNAAGTLVEQSLTQTAGADTAERGDDRYSGTVVVNVRKANHRAPEGTQTYTLENARAKFHDADRNGEADAPKAGDRVKLHGRITTLRKKCDATGFTPTVTVRKVAFKAAKAPKPAKA